MNLINNIYGIMATNTNSSFKLAYQKKYGSLGFAIVTDHNKKPGFIYADTDSIHCDLQHYNIICAGMPDRHIEGFKERVCSQDEINETIIITNRLRDEMR